MINIAFYKCINFEVVNRESLLLLSCNNARKTDIGKKLNLFPIFAQICIHIVYTHTHITRIIVMDYIYTYVYTHVLYIILLAFL